MQSKVFGSYKLALKWFSFQVGIVHFNSRLFISNSDNNHAATAAAAALDGSDQLKDKCLIY